MIRAKSTRGRVERFGLLALALSLTAAAPPTSRFPGRVSVYVPEPTQVGNWDGTWYYASVDAKMAIWMRTRRGTPEVKLRYQSGAKDLSFETDWEGKASYYAAEKPATFEIHITRGDSSEIEGRWLWDVQFGTSGRTENGTFTLFRAQDGRIMVLKFQDYELVVTRGGKTFRTDQPPIWAFTKASKRQVLWDELPF